MVSTCSETTTSLSSSSVESLSVANAGRAVRFRRNGGGGDDNRKEPDGLPRAFKRMVISMSPSERDLRRAPPIASRKNLTEKAAENEGGARGGETHELWISGLTAGLLSDRRVDSPATKLARLRGWCLGMMGGATAGRVIDTASCWWWARDGGRMVRMVRMVQRRFRRSAQGCPRHHLVSWRGLTARLRRPFLAPTVRSPIFDRQTCLRGQFAGPGATPRVASKRLRRRPERAARDNGRPAAHARAWG